MLQRDAPAPARPVRDGLRDRRRRAAQLRLHCRRAVARQPVGPVFVSRLQGLLDEQPAKSRAVDEQIAFHDLVRMQYERLDESTLAILVRVADFSLDAADAAALRERAQEFAVLTRIEVVGEVD